MELEQNQRKDIDTTLNDRLTLGLDKENITISPYVLELKNFIGNNWFKQSEKIVKLNLSETDKISFISEPLSNLQYKDIFDIVVSFDYEVNNVSLNYPILDNVSFESADVTGYKTSETILTTQGHIDVTCSLFDFDNEVLNTAIVEQGFNIALNFNGNKSNATVKLSNVQASLKFRNKLLDESNSVVNRLVPQVDFYREGSKLVLQIGDGTGKGHIDEQYVDTYTKEEIDAKLLGKVNAEIGKGLSTNDYTQTEKSKLANIENNANYYVHPSYHNTSMITEQSELSNLETQIDATQHEINLAIDSKISSISSTVDWDNIENKPSDYPPSSHNHTVNNITDFPNIPSKISDLINDSNFIEKSNVSGLVKNDGSIDTTTYLSSLPSHSHGNLTNDGKVVQLDNPTNMIGIVGVNNTFNIARYSLVLTSKVKDSNAYSNIGTSANATQETINTSIDTTLGNKPNLSDLGDVALSNDYNDLDNLPTIPTIPSNISAFNNDVGYLTQHQSLVNYIQKSNISGLVKNDGTIDTTQYLSSLPSHNHDDRYYTESEVDTALNNKQDTLVSGTSIKTINNTSILGSGNISIGGGGSSVDIATTWGNPTSDSKVPSEKLAKDSLDAKANSNHNHRIFDIDNTSHSGTNALVEDCDYNGQGLGFADGLLIFNQSDYAFYYDKNGGADSDVGNELATLNNIPSQYDIINTVNIALEHMIDNWEDYD